MISTSIAFLFVITLIVLVTILFIVFGCFLSIIIDRILEFFITNFRKLFKNENI